jgi:methylated-DNA-[protein]-cysteine S-methyltransferase
MDLIAWRLDTAIGTVCGAEDETGRLVAVGLSAKRFLGEKLGRRFEATHLRWVDDPLSLRSGRQIAQFLGGKRRRFSLGLDEAGTEFQRAAWRACRTIAYGKTLSYGRLAEKVGRPRAARAVGGAMNQNPIPLVTPCHRVVGADGSLVGFGSGIDNKRRLLEFEAGGRPLLDPAQVPLPVAESDLERATLVDSCGNTGFLGFSPAGDRYHLVVPVDKQIAAGVKAKNRPTDGTPFGGYTGWRYFECPPYAGVHRDEAADADARRERVGLTARALTEWAKKQGLDLSLERE